VAIVAVVVSVVPGILWLWIFYQTDLYEPEPKRLVLATFGVGAAAVIPAWLVEKTVGWYWPALDLGHADHLVPLIAGCFLVIGPIEELCKFLVVRIGIFRNQEFDEPLDGIIYAAAAALGFASLENILYVVDFGHGGRIKWQLLALRSMLALPGHVIFASTWGYALGRRRFEADFPVWPMVLGAAWLHAAYDFVLLYPPARPAIPLVLAAMFPLVVRQIRSLQRRSPFAPVATEPPPGRDAGGGARGAGAT
jgi:RsiW-degrading membrane proteinase PrsW (M82 family)